MKKEIRVLAICILVIGGILSLLAVGIKNGIKEECAKYPIRAQVKNGEVVSFCPFGHIDEELTEEVLMLDKQGKKVIKIIPQTSSGGRDSSRTFFIEIQN